MSAHSPSPCRHAPWSKTPPIAAKQSTPIPKHAPASQKTFRRLSMPALYSSIHATAYISPAACAPDAIGVSLETQLLVEAHHCGMPQIEQLIDNPSVTSACSQASACTSSFTPLMCRTCRVSKEANVANLLGFQGLHRLDYHVAPNALTL